MLLHLQYFYKYFYRIHTAVREKEAVIDVDGSYMYRKHKQLADSGLTVAALPLPLPPLTGWESVSQETVIEIAKKVPHVASGKYYRYYIYRKGA